MFQLKENLDEIIIGINFFDGDFFKFKYDDFSQNYTDFVESFIQGNLTAFYKSEDIPLIEYSDNVLSIVGKNFKEKINNSNKEVLLLVVGRPCGICQNVKKNFNFL